MSLKHLIKTENMEGEGLKSNYENDVVSANAHSVNWSDTIFVFDARMAFAGFVGVGLATSELSYGAWAVEITSRT